MPVDDTRGEVSPKAVCDGSVVESRTSIRETPLDIRTKAKISVLQSQKLIPLNPSIYSFKYTHKI